MPSFSITPRSPYPIPTEPWEGGIQFRENGDNVGPVGPAYVDFVGAGVAATYDPDYGIVTYTLTGGGGGGGSFSVGFGGFWNTYTPYGAVPPTQIGFDVPLLPDYETGFENSCGPNVLAVNPGNFPLIWFEWRGFKPIHGVFLVDAITQQRELPSAFTSAEARDYLAWPVDLSEGFSSIGGGFAGQAFAKLSDPDNIASNGTLLNTFSLTDTGTIIRFNWLGGVTDAVYLIQVARSADRQY